MKEASNFSTRRKTSALWQVPLESNQASAASRLAQDTRKSSIQYGKILAEKEIETLLQKVMSVSEPRKSLKPLSLVVEKRIGLPTLVESSPLVESQSGLPNPIPENIMIQRKETMEPSTLKKSREKVSLESRKSIAKRTSFAIPRYSTSEREPIRYSVAERKASMRYSTAERKQSVLTESLISVAYTTPADSSGPLKISGSIIGIRNRANSVLEGRRSTLSRPSTTKSQNTDSSKSASTSNATTTTSSSASSAKAKQPVLKKKIKKAPIRQRRFKVVKKVASEEILDESDDDSEVSQEPQEIQDTQSDSPSKPTTGVTDSTTETNIESVPITPKQVRKSTAVTKMTSNQLVMLSNMTGAFSGPSDVYAKFLSGGKGIRATAKRALQTALQATDGGQLDEVLVEKSGGRLNPLSRNPRMLERLRQKHKEVLKAKVIEKVESLITHMMSLESHHRTYLALKEENTRLRLEHRKQADDINAQVSETLAKNEESDRLIKNFQKDKTVNRKKLAKEYAAFVKNGKQAILETVEARDNAQKNYNLQSADLENLHEFKTISFSDPEVIANRVVSEEQRRQQLLVKYEDDVKLFGQRFLDEEQEAEKAVVDRVLNIIDEAKLSTSLAYKENRRLQAELKAQLEAQAKLTRSIDENLERKAVLIKERDSANKDSRRVLRYWEDMTCTPEMEFTIEKTRPKSRPVTLVI